MGGAFKNLVKRQVKTVKRVSSTEKKDKMAAKAKGKGETIYTICRSKGKYCCIHFW